MVAKETDDPLFSLMWILVLSTITFLTFDLLLLWKLVPCFLEWFHHSKYHTLPEQSFNRRATLPGHTVALLTERYFSERGGECYQHM